MKSINHLKDDYRTTLYDDYVESHLAPRYEISPESLKSQRPVFRNLLSRFLPVSKEAAILDAGCGHGALLSYLQSEGYRNAVGIDGSKTQVDLAKKLGVSGVDEWNLFPYLTMHSGQFDLITAFDVIEHLKKNEVLEFLKLAFQALKSGGRLIVRTPNGASPFSGAYRYGDFTHELSFTRTSIQQIFTNAGFRSIEIFPVEPVVHGLASAARYGLWKVISWMLRFYLLVETGEANGEILTQNLLATAEK